MLSRILPLAFLVPALGCVNRTQEESLAAAWFEDVETRSEWHLVTFVGDFDGDGLDDVTTKRRDDGALGLTFGREDGLLPDSPDVVFTWTTGACIGYLCPTVSTLGDINGDGRSDIGVPEAQGYTVMVLGRARGGSGEVTLSEEGSVRLEASGLSGLGDLDGDGYDELGLEFGRADNTGMAFGLARGRSSWAGLDFDSALQGGVVISRVETRLTGVGDVNGDGLDDLASSDRGGAVHLHSGAGIPWGAAPADELLVDLGGVSAPIDQSEFDSSPGGAGIPPTTSHSLGDINDDGLGDFLDISPRERAAPFVVFGTDEPSVADRSALSEGVGGFRVDGAFGTLLPLGDVDDDGVTDLLYGGVGSYDYAEHPDTEGLVLSSHIHPLSSGGLTVPSSGAVVPRPTGAFLHGTVATSGDFDGDGQLDLLLGYMVVDYEERAQLLLGQ